MKNIVGVRFRRLGKIYFFDPQYLITKKGDYVIVDTTDGEDIAEVAIPNRKIDEEKIVEPLKRVIRIANNRDMKHYEECKNKEIMKNVRIRKKKLLITAIKKLKN